MSECSSIKTDELLNYLPAQKQTPCMVTCSSELDTWNGKREVTLELLFLWTRFPILSSTAFSKMTKTLAAFNTWLIFFFKVISDQITLPDNPTLTYSRKEVKDFIPDHVRTSGPQGSLWEPLVPFTSHPQKSALLYSLSDSSSLNQSRWSTKKKKSPKWLLSKH